MNHATYEAQYRQYREMQAGEGRFSEIIYGENVCLNDDFAQSFDPHYTLHTAWAARRIAEFKPDFHVDISSCMRFVSMLSAFIPVKSFDYRAVYYPLPGVESGSADLTQLHFADNSVKSLSCLHTIEHIGLGRYGDPVDDKGDRKAARELSRVLAPGGQLLVAFPMGRPRIYWNAHRIYSYRMALDMFPDLKLVEFSMISLFGSQPENSAKGAAPFEFIYNIPDNSCAPALVERETHPCGACGCLRFTK